MLIKNRTAFTMIELIFVIVILGILVAVAIPKLIVTRDDAIISSTATSISSSIMEMAEYCVSKGGSTDDLTVMSNGIASMIRTGKAHKVNEDVVVEIDGVDCITIKVVTNGGSDDLNVSYIDTTNNICLSLQSIIDEEVYSVSLRGITVVQ